MKQALLPQGSYGAPLVHKQLLSSRPTALKHVGLQQMFDPVTYDRLKPVLQSLSSQREPERQLLITQYVIMDYCSYMKQIDTTGCSYARQEGAGTQYM